jgi:hypothetical protein
VNSNQNKDAAEWTQHQVGLLRLLKLMSHASYEVHLWGITSAGRPRNAMLQVVHTADGCLKAMADTSQQLLQV